MSRIPELSSWNTPVVSPRVVKVIAFLVIKRNMREVHLYATLFKQIDGALITSSVLRPRKSNFTRPAISNHLHVELRGGQRSGSR